MRIYDDLYYARITVTVHPPGVVADAAVVRSLMGGWPSRRSLAPIPGR